MKIRVVKFTRKFLAMAQDRMHRQGGRQACAFVQHDVFHVQRLLEPAHLELGWETLSSEKIAARLHSQILDKRLDSPLSEVFLLGLLLQCSDLLDAPVRYRSGINRIEDPQEPYGWAVSPRMAMDIAVEKWRADISVIFPRAGRKSEYFAGRFPFPDKGLLNVLIAVQKVETLKLHQDTAASSSATQLSPIDQVQVKLFKKSAANVRIHHPEMAHVRAVEICSNIRDCSKLAQTRILMGRDHAGLQAG